MSPLLKFGGLFLLLLVNNVKCDDGSSSSASASAGSKSEDGAPPPPPPPPVGPPGIGGGGLGIPGLLGLLGGGLGGGFSKNLNINAGLGGGFGPLLAGLGGLGGGVPPPPAGDAGAGLGGSPWGGLTGLPSYIPSTLIGSALSAKGDVLFPLVLFVFFIVGLWTVVQFLLGLIVPLIASKVSKLKAISVPKFRRSAHDRDEELDDLTQEVWEAFEKFGCEKKGACHAGNMASGFDLNDVESFFSGKAELLEIFNRGKKSGKEDCSQYKCDQDNDKAQKDKH